MALPYGLISVYAFVLTLGISVPTTLLAMLFHHRSNVLFRQSLQTALVGTGSFYLIGVAVVWAVTGPGSLWGVVTALLVTGLAATVILVALPLTAGKRLFQYVQPADSEVALRYTTYGWPFAMLVIFGIFFAPGGVTQGHLFHLGGVTMCVTGFCGIPVSLAATVVTEFVIALLGSGLFGILIHSSETDQNGCRAHS
jgi:hypothetical protein